MPVVDIEVSDGVATVIINRPEARNALNSEVLVRLSDAMKQFRDDSAVRAVVVTGAGDKAFCSGADLQSYIPLISRTRQPQDEWDRRVLSERGTMDPGKPVIAAINGFAVAGGMELLYGMDLRVAVEDARFGLQEARWALFPAGGSTVWLPRQMPHAVAMELLLTGELIDAARAYELGFVNRVVPRGELMQTALSLAAKIAANGPLAVRAIRESARAVNGLPVAEALKIEAEHAAPVFASKDAVEGPRAFLEKRTPQFEGR
jgi:enoyl-CoA hydratase